MINFAVAGELLPAPTQSRRAAGDTRSDPAGHGESSLSHTRDLHVLADRVENPELRAELHDVTRKTARLIVALQFRIRELKRKSR